MTGGGHALAVGTLAVGTLAARAEAAEYRRVELADGRTLVAEVVATDAHGLVLALPQGRARVAFVEVLRIAPEDAAVYADQPPLRVAVLPFAALDGAAPADAEVARRRVAAAFARVPEVVAVEPPAGTPEAERLGACGLDASCVVAAGAALEADVAVLGALAQPGDAEELALASVFLAAPRAQRRVSLAGDGDPADVAWALLALERPSDAPTAARAPAWTALAPVPGLPQWIEGDPGRALLAAGIAVPVAAGIVAAAGAATTRPEDLVVVGAIAWWSASALANRALLVPEPREDGAGLRIAGSF